MLEVKGLRKTYVPKKGVPVVALNGVSLQFEETGLVFVLGKSGSGKSTLLNLLGGLDKYDDGDIVIKGKSTKDFTQGNFDSYRNTYVGFIFQEYNILDEFSVGANIALAIELQGRKASDQEVNEILDVLDLTDYGIRRPNELSGGQKQRVAIARALVKKPDIILADEPTGALDSKTGIQIFETLKKLSENKLVIVVSHDREFAEEFGDRVIELADGVVISDIKKETYRSSGKAENIQYNEQEGLIVKEGYRLTAKDLDMINKYLETNKSLNLVTKDESEFNTRTAFVETKDNLDIKTYQEEFTMIKSKLPYKMSFRIGASGLNHKKFRLFFTILLSLVAFTLFGVADSMAAYNKIDATVNSIIDGEIKAAALSKYLETPNDYGYLDKRELTISQVDIDYLNDKIGEDIGVSFKPVYTGGKSDYSGAFNLNENIISDSNQGWYQDRYYLGYLSGFAEFNDLEIKELGFQVHGRLPISDNEIAISKYIYDHFDEKGYRLINVTNSKEIKADNINSYDDIIGEVLRIQLHNKYIELEITGVIDTKFDNLRYNKLKTSSSENMIDYFLFEELRTVVNYGYHGLGYVNKGYIDNLAEENKVSGIEVFNFGQLSYFAKRASNDPFNKELYVRSANKLSNYESDEVIFFDNTKTELKENEIIINANRYIEMLPEVMITIDNYPEINGSVKDIFYKLRENIIREYATLNYSIAEDNNFYIDRFGNRDLTEERKIIELYDYLAFQEGQIEKKYVDKTGIEIYQLGMKPYIQEISEQVDELNLDRFFYRYGIKIDDKELISTKVVGIFISSNFDNYDNVIIDNEFYNDLKVYGEVNPYAFAIAVMPKGRDKIKNLAIFNETGNADIYFRLKNQVTPMLEMANDMVESVASVFLYIGIGFAVFSALMLSNFIGTSVSRKKREIGILRAVGARSGDVFGIFFNESLIIAIINFVVSSISTMVVVKILNDTLRDQGGITVTIFNFGFRQVFLLLIISVFIAAAASYLPVSRIARKKPVDAISNK